jgi:hypothetical protein
MKTKVQNCTAVVGEHAAAPMEGHNAMVLLGQLEGVAQVFVDSINHTQMQGAHGTGRLAVKDLLALF